MNLILFDFDKTIYDGDSSFDFFIFCLKKQKKLFLTIPKMIVIIIKYKLKIINKTVAKENIFYFLTEIKNIDEMIELFWKENQCKIKLFFKNQDYKKVVIISASPEFLLKPIAEKYKIKKLIATKVNKKSGKFESENCYGKEKVKRFYNEFSKEKIKEMYSDSLSDKPLLDIAEKSYIVKKDKIVLYK